MWKAGPSSAVLGGQGGGYLILSSELCSQQLLLLQSMLVMSEPVHCTPHRLSGCLEHASAHCMPRREQVVVVFRLVHTCSDNLVTPPAAQLIEQGSLMHPAPQNAATTRSLVCPDGPRSPLAWLWLSVEACSARRDAVWRLSWAASFLALPMCLPASLEQVPSRWCCRSLQASAPWSAELCIVQWTAVDGVDMRARKVWAGTQPAWLSWS